MATPQSVKLTQEDFLIPEWQIKLGEEALQSVEDGTAELMEWEEAKKQFKLSAPKFR